MKVKLISSRKVLSQKMPRRSFLALAPFFLVCPSLSNAASQHTCGGVIDSNAENSSSSATMSQKVTYAEVELLQLKLDKNRFYSEELMSGKLTVRNNTPNTKFGNLRFSLIDEWDIELPSIEESFINVPAFSQSEYYFSEGPSLYVKKNRQVSFKASSSSNSLLDNEIVILA